MNKAELVVAVSETTQVSKREAEKIIEVVFEEIGHALEQGEVVKVSGFGTFQVKDRKARIGTSPVTGQKINIPATKAIGFKASKNLKELIK